MKNHSLTRSSLQLISKNSDISAGMLKKGFIDEGVYTDKTRWVKFLSLVALSLGAAFCLAGLIFFLAYNWHLMHRFVKLGLVQALLIGVVIALLALKNLNPLTRNIMLMSASVLVGALFSVFGQIYQTGADAYDFFLGWTVFVALWAFAAKFYPLWLLLITLVNVTFLFYVSQAGPDWSQATNCFIISVFNAIILHTVYFLHGRKRIETLPSWFARIVELTVAVFITYGMIFCIDSFENLTIPFTIFTLANYGYSGYRSYKQQEVFSLCVSALSLIIISCFLISRVLTTEVVVMFFNGLFVILSITFLSRWLIKLNKKWNEAN